MSAVAYQIEPSYEAPAQETKAPDTGPVPVNNDAGAAAFVFGWPAGIVTALLVNYAAMKIAGGFIVTGWIGLIGVLTAYLGFMGAIWIAQYQD